jgi:hypothetical protein
MDNTDCVGALLELGRRIVPDAPISAEPVR